jgi:hypothetical protein
LVLISRWCCRSLALPAVGTTSRCQVLCSHVLREFVRILYLLWSRFLIDIYIAIPRRVFYSFSSSKYRHSSSSLFHRILAVFSHLYLSPYPHRFLAITSLNEMADFLAEFVYDEAAGFSNCDGIPYFFYITELHRDISYIYLTDKKPITYVAYDYNHLKCGAVCSPTSRRGLLLILNRFLENSWALPNFIRIVSPSILLGTPWQIMTPLIRSLAVNSGVFLSFWAPVVLRGVPSTST